MSDVPVRSNAGKNAFLLKLPALDSRSVQASRPGLEDRGLQLENFSQSLPNIPVLSSITGEQNTGEQPLKGLPLLRAVDARKEQILWVHDINTSVIEKIPDPAKVHHFLFVVDWSKESFPGTEHAKTDNATSLLAEIKKLLPERRVTKLPYIKSDPFVLPVPGVTAHHNRLLPDALEAFGRMKRDAAADRITLLIYSAFRSEKDQAVIKTTNKNPNAVAQKISAHSYGRAIDLILSGDGLALNNTTKNMVSFVQLYRSPVYKWMFLFASRYGFYPFSKEPWHWEYNPPADKPNFNDAVAPDRLNSAV